MKGRLPSSWTGVLACVCILLMLVWIHGTGTAMSESAMVHSPSPVAPAGRGVRSSVELVEKGQPQAADLEGDWVIECVDCPKHFDAMTDRSLRLDSDGNPHIAYGGDHLYYAWYDGAEWQYETADETLHVLFFK